MQISFAAAVFLALLFYPILCSSALAGFFSHLIYMCLLVRTFECGHTHTHFCCQALLSWWLFTQSASFLIVSIECGVCVYALARGRPQRRMDGKKVGRTVAVTYCVCVCCVLYTLYSLADRAVLNANWCMKVFWFVKLKFTLTVGLRLMMCLSVCLCVCVLAVEVVVVSIFLLLLLVYIHHNFRLLSTAALLSCHAIWREAQWFTWQTEEFFFRQTLNLVYLQWLFCFGYSSTRMVKSLSS